MLKSNLDVWAIQKYPEELDNALSNIKINSQDNILFSNCSCNMRIGSKHVTRNFDTMLYAEDSDTLVILMKDGKATTEDIRKNLDNRNILYHEVIFDKEEDSEYYDDESIKELCFAREAYVLEDAVVDSKNRGYNKCIYYPAVDGNLDLQYLDNNSELSVVDGRFFKGVVEFPDKMVLLINQNDPRNVTSEVVLGLFGKYEISVLVDSSRNIKSLEDENSKVLKK